METQANKHGGDISRACALFGGAPADWIDLSTGINRQPYLLPVIPENIWHALPDRLLFDTAAAAARTVYKTNADCLPVAGAQAAIQMIPRVFSSGAVSIVSPTYNEHATCFRAAGWKVFEGSVLEDLPLSDACVVVNPNNPDGRIYTAEALSKAAQRHGLLIVDESFADVLSEEPTFATADLKNVLVLRSIGKFFGLAGLRLGFVLGAPELLAPLRDFAGPWAVSGPALYAGTAALNDTSWQHNTRVRLQSDARRLDSLVQNSDWNSEGGTALFRLYRAQNAASAQQQLAKFKIWSRCFDYDQGLIRLGLPGPECEWSRLETAFLGIQTIKKAHPFAG